MPDPQTADAEIESWRCLRSALVGEPVPIISGDIARDVIARLADCAAGALADRLGDDAGPGLALGYVWNRGWPNCLWPAS